MPRRKRVKKSVRGGRGGVGRAPANGLDLPQAVQIDDPDVLALCVDQAALLKS